MRSCIFTFAFVDGMGGVGFMVGVSWRTWFASSLVSRKVPQSLKFSKEWHTRKHKKLKVLKTTFPRSGMQLVGPELGA